MLYEMLSIFLSILFIFHAKVRVFLSIPFYFVAMQE